MDYTIEEYPAFSLVGSALRTTNQEWVSMQEIPAHWGAFFEKQLLNTVEGRTDQNVIGLYCEYEGDFMQPYTLVAGGMIDSSAEAPEGLVKHTVPMQKYAVFTSTGGGEGVAQTWGQIWESDIDRAYTYDFECYTPEFFADPKGGEAKIYIAVNE